MKDRVAIVTGASRGIGEAIAVKLAAHGAHVVITGTNEERLTLVAKKVNEINQECLVFTGNVANPKSAQNLVEETMQRFNRIDILVNNAGINMRIPTLSLTPEDWCKVIDTNLNGTFYTCAAVLPIMVQQRYGRIVNVSSSTSKTPHRNASPSYGASKAGVNYLTQHLAYEMAKHNIRVNAVCPGPIETDMSQQWNEEYRKELLKRIPLGHTGKTRDVANAVLFLASDSCDFITGETININGGTYMN